jgi:uncharacterized protein (DUF983 family)
MKDPSASLFTMLGRSMTRRCPRCGAKGVFANWAAMKEFCPTCGFKFEREPGYWVGALIINMAMALFVFLVTMVGGMALFWPDVPWNALSAAVIGVMLVVPVAFYPWSKSIWMAIELSYHKLEEKEQFEASLRAADAVGGQANSQ